MFLSLLLQKRILQKYCKNITKSQNAEGECRFHIKVNQSNIYQLMQEKQYIDVKLLFFFPILAALSEYICFKKSPPHLVTTIIIKYKSIRHPQSFPLF